jgi:hypothetical protein
MNSNPDQEVTKAEFKSLFFKHATPNSGWSDDYWQLFYEKETGKTYFYAKPQTPEYTRMFIISDSTKRRMIFLTEDAEEVFFDFPDKE